MGAPHPEALALAERRSCAPPSLLRTAVQGGGLRCFERLTAVMHRRAETGEQVATAVQSSALPFFALHRLCPLAVGGVPVVAVLFAL